MPPAILALSDFKKQFDPILARELERHIARAIAFTSDKECHEVLSYIRELALAGGKRVRPYAAYLMYRTAGGSDKNILEKLVAFEILHTFALIHDDIIDRGLLRHGRPSMQEFTRAYVNGSGEKEQRLADGLAILAGDLAFSWSRESFSQTASGAEAQALFDDMVYAVVLGQMIDVKIMCEANPSEAAIMEKTSLKTAEYTFVYPMRIGAALAGKSEAYDAWCKKVGASLGTAFQMQDDLLDIIGEESTTGKRPLQDYAEGQHTVFTAYLRANGVASDVAEFNEQFGKEAVSDNGESAKKLRALFERSGALEYGKNLLEGEIAKAKEALAELDADAGAVEMWSALISLMEKRTA